MMKNLSLFAYLLLAVAVIFTASSCGEDDGVITLGPSITVTNSPSGDVIPGDDFTVTISAAKGDAALKSLTVYEDGVKVDLGRLVVDGAAAGANPKLIVGTDVDGFTWEVTITAHTDASTRSYSFEVADENSKTDEASVDISTAATPPSLVLNGSNDILTAPSSLLAVNLSITAGSNKLSTIGVFEDGNLMSAADLYYKDPTTGQFTDNPETFASEDEDLFNDNIYIRVSMDGGPHTYTIEVTDANGITASLDLSVNIGTPVDMEFTAVVVNNADGPDNGGLDLDNGVNVPAASGDAEIRDMGIDINQPVDANWLQQIEAVNGASIRTPDSSQPEAFDFAAANTKEAIIAAYDAGDDVSEPDVAIDDIFLVKRGEDYFILKVTKIVVTPSDNADLYEFDVKQALK